MPLIGIDCRFGSVYGGLGTYTRELVSALLQRHDPWEYVLFCPEERPSWLESLKLGNRARVIEAPFAHYSLSEQLEFPNLLQDSDADLLLFPHFNVPLSCPIPFVCTVHDLILHRFPNESGWLKRMAYRFVLRQALSRARAVSTVSEYTKSDLRSVYGSVFDQKTHVVYPGINPVFHHRKEAERAPLFARHGLDRPYFLYVGNCKEHKNVQTLVEAYRKAALPSTDLVLVSGGRESAHIQRVEGVRFLSGLNEDDLACLMSGALACVTATLLEGFCLPLVEAMACRTPVLGTWAGPIPEVCGSHALLAEPTVDAFVSALKTLVTDHTIRTTARLDAAEAWAHAYTWKRAAEQTVRLFQYDEAVS